MIGKKFLTALVLGSVMTLGISNINVEGASKPAAIKVQETALDFKSAQIDKNITRIRNGAGDLMFTRSHTW